MNIYLASSTISRINCNKWFFVLQYSCIHKLTSDKDHQRKLWEIWACTNTLSYDKDFVDITGNEQKLEALCHRQYTATYIWHHWDPGFYCKQ